VFRHIVILLSYPSAMRVPLAQSACRFDGQWAVTFTKFLSGPFAERTRDMNRTNRHAVMLANGGRQHHLSEQGLFLLKGITVATRLAHFLPDLLRLDPRFGRHHRQWEAIGNDLFDDFVGQYR